MITLEHVMRLLGITQDARMRGTDVRMACADRAHAAASRSIERAALDQVQRADDIRITVAAALDRVEKRLAP